MKNYIHCLLKIIPVWGSGHPILTQEALVFFRKQLQLLNFINNVLQGINPSNESKEPFSLQRFYATQRKGFFRRICFIHLQSLLTRVHLGSFFEVKLTKKTNKKKVHFKFQREIQQIEEPLITIKILAIFSSYSHTEYPTYMQKRSTHTNTHTHTHTHTHTNTHTFWGGREYYKIISTATWKSSWSK